jgi:hypothetical protein
VGSIAGDKLTIDVGKGDIAAGVFSLDKAIDAGVVPRVVCTVGKLNLVYLVTLHQLYLCCNNLSTCSSLFVAVLAASC